MRKFCKGEITYNRSCTVESVSYLKGGGVARTQGARSAMQDKAGERWQVPGWSGPFKLEVFFFRAMGRL